MSKGCSKQEVVEVLKWAVKCGKTSLEIPIKGKLKHFIWRCITFSLYQITVGKEGFSRGSNMCYVWGRCRESVTLVFQVYESTDSMKVGSSEVGWFGEGDRTLPWMIVTVVFLKHG